MGDLTDQAKAIIQIHLEEFKTVREELNLHLHASETLVNIYAIGIVGILGLTFSNGNALLLMIIAFVSPMFATAWMLNENGTKRLALYIDSHLHEELAPIVGSDSILMWERYAANYHLGRVPKGRMQSVIFRVGGLGMFLVPALLSALGSAIYIAKTFKQGVTPHDYRLLAWILCGIAIVLNLVCVAYWRLYLEDPHNEFAELA